MPLFIYCPKCEARFDVTDCGDASRFLCDECGTEVTVRFANLILMPGGIATEIKEMADGSRWLVCPKCGRNSNISGISPGNRFRCRRCSMLLQVPSPHTVKPIPPARGPEDVIKCPGCRTRYDTSRYTPGNRFRCRRCGMTLSVPQRTSWKNTGEWEIDVDKSLIRCNRCNQTYPLGSVKKGESLVCRKCRKVFSGLGEPPAAALHKEPEEEWAIDLDAGYITCPGCRYSYDLSSLPQDADFPCKHCDRVFRMPKEIPKETVSDPREKIACGKCGTEYDVSGYLKGTMFSCSNCEEILYIGVSGGYTPSPDQEESPEVLSRPARERAFTPEALETRSEPPLETAAIQDHDPVAPAQAEIAKPAEEAPETPAPEPDTGPETGPEPGDEIERSGQPVHAFADDAPESAPKPEEKPAPLPIPSAEPAQHGRRPSTARSAKPEKPRAEAQRKVPVPFPPLPPEQVLAKAKRTETIEDQPAPAAAPEKPASAPPAGESKTVVRLIVRCTVCGARHDAGGMAEGDKITCKCGKKIKIKGGRKPEAKPSQDPVEDALSKRAVKSDDIEVLDRE